jgi:hypothetical protein
MESALNVQPVLDPKRLRQWISAKRNVLFTAERGVGKTLATKAAFESAGYVWGDTALYFSAPTLDPWVDLVGMPRRKTDYSEGSACVTAHDAAQLEDLLGSGDLEALTNFIRSIAQGMDGRDYLDIIPPRRMKNVRAVFIDELNRAHAKTTNALLELVQFKCINGIRYPDLEVVWAAVNPEDEDGTYDVKRVDPALKDRFHIWCDVDYRPCPVYFSQKYGNQGKAAISWWDRLGGGQGQVSDLQRQISPRRLEYVIEAFRDNLDIRDVLPKGTNVTDLIVKLKDGPMLERLQEIHMAKDEDAARRIIEDPNDFEEALVHINRTASAIPFFLKYATGEQMAVALSRFEKVVSYVVLHMDEVPSFKQSVKQALESGANPKVVEDIQKSARRHGKSLDFAKVVSPASN